MTGSGRSCLAWWIRGAVHSGRIRSDSLMSHVASRYCNVLQDLSSPARNVLRSGARRPVARSVGSLPPGDAFPHKLLLPIIVAFKLCAVRIDRLDGLPLRLCSSNSAREHAREQRMQTQIFITS